MSTVRTLTNHALRKKLIITTPDAKTCYKAMISEMDSIKENDTWELVPLLIGRKPLPCKWVYRYKYVFGSDQPKYKA